MTISLGDVNFNLGADTRSLQQSVNLLRQFGQTVDSVQTQTTQSANATAAAFRKQEAAITSALNQTLRLASGMRKVKDGEQYAQQTAAAFEKLNRTMTSGQLSALQHQRAMEQFRASMGNTTRAFKEFSTATETAAGKGQFFANLMKTMQSSFVLIQGPLGGIATRISTVTSLLGTAGGAFVAFGLGVAAAGYAVYKAGEQLLDAGVKMNKLQSQMEAVTGSTALASSQINTLFGIARKTGQSIDDLTPSFAKFEMAAKGAGLSTNEINREFTVMAMAATKLQMSGEDTQGMFKALEQMLSKGTVQAEELRGQLGDRLPGAFNIAARAMGVTTQQLNKMMKAGEVISNDFLPKFIDELQRSLKIDASKPIDNYASAVGNLQTSWLQLRVEIEKHTHVTDQVIDAYKGITAWMDNFRESIAKVPGELRDIGYMWTVVSKDLVDRAQPWIELFTVVWDDIKKKADDFFKSLPQSATMSWADLIDTAYKATNATLDVLYNLNEVVMKLFTELPKAIANSVVESMNWMISTIKEGLNSLFAIIRDRSSDISKVFPSLKDILPMPQDLDLGDTIKKPFETTWSSITEFMRTQMGEQHHLLDEAIAKIKEWKEAAADLKYSSEGGRGPQRRFANGTHLNDNVGAGASEVEMTDKQVKALERKQEAMKNIEDEIDRQREKLEALGGTDANLRSLNEEFKREKEVEKYGKALRKAGADSEYIKQKTQELNEVLKNVDAAEKQREALMDLRDSFVSGFDAISESILGAFENGENAAQAFKTTIKKVVNDIIDTFLKLAILNPFKNWLFGTDLPTLGFGGASGGGNILSSILPGLFGSGNAGGGASSSAASQAASSLVPMNTGGSSLMRVMSATIPANDNTIGGTMQAFAASIRKIESGSFAGNYNAIGNLTASGDRAYGAYQVMGNNIPSWTKGATGTSLSPSQFLGNKPVQDAVFSKYFGGAMDKFGSPQQAASVWFTGQPISPRSSMANDINGTTGAGYVQQFNAGVKEFNAGLSKMSANVAGANPPLNALGNVSTDATQGLATFGNALNQFPSAPAAPSGGLGSLFGGMFGWPSFSSGVMSDFTSGALGLGLFAKGGAFGSSGQIPVRNAKGNVYGGSHVFGFGGGNLGMLGEAGEEAVMPLTRDSHGNLGVRGGNGGGNMEANVNIIDRAGVRVSYSKRRNANGNIDITAVIDQTVADRLSRRGTDSSNALRKTWGAQGRLKGR